MVMSDPHVVEKFHEHDHIMAFEIMVSMLESSGISVAPGEFPSWKIVRVFKFTILNFMIELLTHLKSLISRIPLRVGN